ncbi:formylglycine-generating enzyme family protein [Pseudomonas mohnii]
MRAIKFAISVFGVCGLVGCEKSLEPIDTTDEKKASLEMTEFVEELKKGLVFVEGGEFLMGDYGVEHGPEGLPYDADKDSKPLHKVELTSYSIEKVKVTNRAFQFYLKYNGLQLRQDVAGIQYKTFSVAPHNPAHMDWYEAEKYCKWLADISDLPYALRQKNTVSGWQTSVIYLTH